MAVTIPFVHEIDFEYRAVDQVSPLIRRVVAENPSKFTYKGTGTYIVGTGEVAVIDPGPLLDEHVDALLAATAGETVTHILITHTHRDHSPAAAPFKAATGALTWGFGPHAEIDSDPEGEDDQSEDTPGEENTERGYDEDFTPDIAVRHGDVIGGSDWTFTCVHTPGHTSNHMCFALNEERALFTGDHVMGWSTSVISPPDGSIGQYLDSLRLLLARDDEVYWPTHGPPITAPRPHVQAFLDHRLSREDQILECLASGASTIDEMVAVMYVDVDEKLHKPAARSVYAHLVHLVDAGKVGCDADEPRRKASYTLV